MFTVKTRCSLFPGRLGAEDKVACDLLPERTSSEVGSELSESKVRRGGCIGIFIAGLLHVNKMTMTSYNCGL